MSEHELTIVPYAENYLGECTCGWICRRSRERDVRREHRKHCTEAKYKKLGINPENPNPDGSDYHLMNADGETE